MTQFVKDAAWRKLVASGEEEPGGQAAPVTVIDISTVAEGIIEIRLFMGAVALSGAKSCHTSSSLN